MAMYYYASKLNEASCSSANRRNTRAPPPTPPPEPAPSPAPGPPVDQPPIVADPSLLRAGNGLSYYDNDDYYSMVRGNKFISESACQHIILNGGINFVATQKVDAPQLQAVLSTRALAALPYMNCADRPEIEYRDGQILTGTLDALVDMLRPTVNKSFKFTFLLCSRLFIKPHELLNKLCKKYFKNYDNLRENENMDYEIVRQEIEDMGALVTLFSEWTIMFPYDFRDDRVMALVRIITERCAAEHMAEVGVRMSSTLEKLLDKLTALEHYEETLVQVAQMTSVDQLTPGDILTLGLTPVELANQLTIVELHKLSFIGPEEFVQAFAPHSTTHASSDAAASSINLHHLGTKCTRNLEGYADWFNRLSYLVATDVLKSSKSKYRARVIEQWVMTARECFNLGNFNSLMAIISALNMSPVTRLKKTWSRTSNVCGQQLKQLELCVDPSGNHARYRAALAAAPTETAVPLLSVTCRDLHFANQGPPTNCRKPIVMKWTECVGNYKVR